MPPTVRPSELELQVLAVLWEHGPQTVRHLLEAMPDGKRRAYTTLLSVLQVMEKKGLVSHTRDGQSYVYRPAVKRNQVLRPLMRDLLHNIFGGRPSAALQYLLADASVDDAELRQIRQLIDDNTPDVHKPGGAS